jgi:hypothetical protein
MQRRSSTSRPTIPKAAVKIRSRYALANEENGPTHPIIADAVFASGQVESTTKGGDIEFK